MTVSEYVLQFRSDDGKTQIENLDGVAYYTAALPPRIHQCKPQTRGYINYFDPVYRCACGAISRDAKCWSEQNSRHKDGAA